MKKTLTLFLIGAMALGTATTLSSCSPSSNKETASDDVITLKEFRKCKKEFHMLALGHVSIVPEEPIAGAQGAGDDTVYVRGYAEFFGATYDCEFTYRTDERYGEDGSFYEPVFATLWITFEHLNAITDSSVLATMGMDPQGPGMTGATLELQFNFTTHEVEVLSSQQGTVTINYPDPMGEYITFNAWLRSVMNANFYVTKRGANE